MGTLGNLDPGATHVPEDAVPATLAELEAALPHILAAPRDATVAGRVCFRPGFNRRSYPDRLRLTVAEGIPGERWASHPWLRLADGRPDSRIQVSVLPARVAAATIRPGMFDPGDTVIADLDCSQANLPAGTRLRLGTAVVEVSDLWNDGCVKWKARYGRAAHDFVRDPGRQALRLRGILCAIVEDGELAPGDPIVRL